MKQSKEHEVNAELVSSIEIFSKLEKKQINSLARLCIYRTFPKGEVIIEEGDTGLGLFIITSGKVEVFREVDQGRVTLASLKAGACVGEMALIDDTPRSASVAAIEDTECLLITRDSFNTLTKKDPGIILRIASTLVDKVRNVNDKLVQLQVELARPSEFSSIPALRSTVSTVEEEGKRDTAIAKPEVESRTETETIEKEEKNILDYGRDYVDAVVQLHVHSFRFWQKIIRSVL